MDIKRTEKYIVAYIDILGAKELIKKNTYSTNIISHAYEMALKVNKIFFDKMDSSCTPKVRIFSDNIVIAKQVECPENKDNIKKSFSCVAKYITKFQFEMLHSQLLVRGSIVYGDFFIDENIVWGQALVDAYNLESNVAIYPRVIVSRNLEKMITERVYSDYNSGKMPEYHALNTCPIFHFCQRDENDFALYINYLNGSEQQNQHFLKQSIDKIKENINPIYYHKLMWHFNYIKRNTDSESAHKIICESYDE